MNILRDELKVVRSGHLDDLILPTDSRSLIRCNGFVSTAILDRCKAVIYGKRLIHEAMGFWPEAE